MYTEKELLELAGKMAIAAKQLLESTPYNLSERADKLDLAVNEYNNAIMENMNER